MKKYLLFTLITIITLPSVTFGSLFISNLIQGQTPEEAIQTIATNIDNIFNKVETIENNQTKTDEVIQSIVKNNTASEEAINQLKKENENLKTKQEELKIQTELNQKQAEETKINQQLTELKTQLALEQTKQNELKTQQALLQAQQAQLQAEENQTQIIANKPTIPEQNSSISVSKTEYSVNTNITKQQKYNFRLNTITIRNTGNTDVIIDKVTIKLHGTATPQDIESIRMATYVRGFILYPTTDPITFEQNITFLGPIKVTVPETNKGLEFYIDLTNPKSNEDPDSTISLSVESIETNAKVTGNLPINGLEFHISTSTKQ